MTHTPRALGLLVPLAMLLAGPFVAAAQEIQFEKIQLDATFRSEGVAAADVNRDGMMDVLAGDVWYEAPDWKMHAIRPVGSYDGTTGYSESFGNFADDVNGDGWDDLVLIGFPGKPCYWYENPRGESGHWKQRMIWPSACNESPQYADLTGDGKRELVMAFQPQGQMGWFTAPTDLEQTWTMHPISEPKSPGTDRFSHGLGIADVNGDGRNDVLITAGWWEAPAEPTGRPWTFHRAPFGDACADMYTYDVDGDGDNDVLSSSAHNYGIWWYEQAAGKEGTEWIKHTIDDSFSQTHALHLVDMNGDGTKDLVTGKRYFAHQGHDPGGKEPVVLYWFELRRGKGSSPEFVPHKIDVGAGIGTQFAVEDFNGDNLPDIITSNKKGVHVLLQRRK